MIKYDGAAPPLTYEKRDKRLGPEDPELNRIIEESIAAARADGELSKEQEAKL